jgi:CxxC motif-containing protein
MVMELVCIVCPVSCNLEVVMEDGKIKEIKGAGCKRGVKYVLKFNNVHGYVKALISLCYS